MEQRSLSSLWSKLGWQAGLSDADPILGASVQSDEQTVIQMSSFERRHRGKSGYSPSVCLEDDKHGSSSSHSDEEKSDVDEELGADDKHPQEKDALVDYEREGVKTGEGYQKMKRLDNKTQTDILSKEEKVQTTRRTGRAQDRTARNVPKRNNGDDAKCGHLTHDRRSFSTERESIGRPYTSLSKPEKSGKGARICTLDNIVNVGFGRNLSTATPLLPQVQSYLPTPQPSMSDEEVPNFSTPRLRLVNQESKAKCDDCNEEIELRILISPHVSMAKHDVSAKEDNHTLETAQSISTISDNDERSGAGGQSKTLEQPSIHKESCDSNLLERISSWTSSRARVWALMSILFVAAGLTCTTLAYRSPSFVKLDVPIFVDSSMMPVEKVGLAFVNLCYNTTVTEADEGDCISYSLQPEDVKDVRFNLARTCLFICLWTAGLWTAFLLLLVCDGQRSSVPNMPRFLRRLLFPDLRLLACGFAAAYCLQCGSLSVLRSHLCEMHGCHLDVGAKLVIGGGFAWIVAIAAVTRLHVHLCADNAGVNENNGIGKVLNVWKMIFSGSKAPPDQRVLLGKKSKITPSLDSGFMESHIPVVIVTEPSMALDLSPGRSRSRSPQKFPRQGVVADVTDESSPRRHRQPSGQGFSAVAPRSPIVHKAKRGRSSSPIKSPQRRPQSNKQSREPVSPRNRGRVKKTETSTKLIRQLRVKNNAGTSSLAISDYRERSVSPTKSPQRHRKLPSKQQDIQTRSSQVSPFLENTQRGHNLPVCLNKTRRQPPLSKSNSPQNHYLLP